jgi:hypothetical protein
MASTRACCTALTSTPCLLAFSPFAAAVAAVPNDLCAHDDGGFAAPLRRYKVGPAFATEYNGYPGDEVDYGAATDEDWNAAGGREAKDQDCFEPGDLSWLQRRRAGAGEAAGGGGGSKL